MVGQVNGWRVELLNGWLEIVNHQSLIVNPKSHFFIFSLSHFLTSLFNKFHPFIQWFLYAI